MGVPAIRILKPNTKAFQWIMALLQSGICIPKRNWSNKVSAVCFLIFLYIALEEEKVKWLWGEQAGGWWVRRQSVLSGDELLLTCHRTFCHKTTYLPGFTNLTTSVTFILNEISLRNCWQDDGQLYGVFQIIYSSWDWTGSKIILIYYTVWFTRETTVAYLDKRPVEHLQKQQLAVNWILMPEYEYEGFEGEKVADCSSFKKRWKLLLQVLAILSCSWPAKYCIEDRKSKNKLQGFAAFLGLPRVVLMN